MSKKLVSRNPDVFRLVEKGYAVAFDGGYMIVRDIPYLDAERALQWGALVTKLVFSDPEHVTQEDHQVFFAGGHPHELDSRPISNLGGGPATLFLSPSAHDIVVQRSFSNKPRGSGKFDDLFHKIESYVTIVSGPAMELHRVNPFTFRFVSTEDEDPIFKIQDTLTSRAEIGELSARLANEVVAVIGLGGTGGYVLDFLVKSSIGQIRGFDADVFHVHNAFRSPGGVELDEFRNSKADVYLRRYESFRRGLLTKAIRIDASSSDEVEGVTFAFVCVDNGSSRAGIFDLLIAQSIPFIDVGMGLDRKQGPIAGLVRTTYYPPELAEQRRRNGLAPLTDNPDDIYRTNVQIAELNALNASLAVIKFKQLKGFYDHDDSPDHSLFDVGDLRIIGL